MTKKREIQRKEENPEKLKDYRMKTKEGRGGDDRSKRKRRRSKRRSKERK